MSEENSVQIHPCASITNTKKNRKKSTPNNDENKPVRQYKRKANPTSGAPDRPLDQSNKIVNFEMSSENGYLSAGMDDYTLSKYRMELGQVLAQQAELRAKEKKLRIQIKKLQRTVHIEPAEGKK